MNDFTKEELKDIKNGIEFLLQEDHCDSGYTIEIRSLEDKIQFMIDNYCEHEYKKTLVGCFRNTCHKCQHSKPWDIAEELKVIE